jgi:hypothetical protein
MGAGRTDGFLVPTWLLLERPLDIGLQAIAKYSWPK